MNRRRSPALLHRVGLGRPQHGAGAQGAARAAHAARLDRSRPPCPRRSTTPRRSQASASPRASRAGSTRPQWGVNDAARAPAHAHALVELGRLEQPQVVLAHAERAPALDGLVQARDLGRARRHQQRAAVQPAAVDALVRDHAARSRPPRRPWRARRGARRRRRAGARSAAALPASPAEAQPPLRPDGPKPAISRSTTAMRRSGCSEARKYAAQSPVKPAPTIATSQSRSPASAGRGVSGSARPSSQRLRAR